MALTPPKVAELNQSMKHLLEIWMKIKLAMQRAFGREEITKEHEGAFLKLKSDLSRLYRVVADQLPRELSFEGDQMIELMKNATTMEHLRALPVKEKRNVFSQWHKIYVLMTRTYGAFEVLNEGYYPSLHRALLAPKGAAKKGRGRAGVRPR